MENRALLSFLFLILFASAGFLVGFVFTYDILLLATPPIYFALTYTIICKFQKAELFPTLKDGAIIIAGFYVGFFASNFSIDIQTNLPDKRIVASLIHSVIGGTTMLLLLWRRVKGAWKYPFALVATLLAGWIFNQFWIGSWHGLATAMELKHANYHDSFSSWFAIIGSSTVLVLLYSRKSDDSHVN